MESARQAEFVYRIDAHQRLVFVSEHWGSFGEENHGRHLAAEQVLGRSLWDFITDQTTIEIYRALVARVVQTACVAQFPFRCDSPGARRHMWMILSALENGACQFSSRILREEPRTFVPLLDPLALRDPRAFVTVCSWCKKVAVPNTGWLEVERAVGVMELFGTPLQPQLTHGICPPCEAGFHEEIESWNGSTRGSTSSSSSAGSTVSSQPMTA